MPVQKFSAASDNLCALRREDEYTRHPLFLLTPMPPRLRRSFFDRSVHKVAPELIGATLLVDGIGGGIEVVASAAHSVAR